LGKPIRRTIRSRAGDSFLDTLRAVSGLLDKRLIFVTGKGGVGKSTVAAALGMVAARQGRRTIVAEVAHQDRVARAFTEEDSHFREVRMAPDLYTISIDPQHALEEYLRIQVRVRALADVLSGSRMFQYFAVATPGMSELVTMGKIWELAQLERPSGSAAYDLVIVDAPATGHGVAIMRTPKTFADIARIGPVAQQGRAIHATITDGDFTGVVAVALPEEMPVSETIMLSGILREELGLDIDRIVVNGLYPDRFKPAEAQQLRGALDHAGSPESRAALRAALSEHGRASEQREQVARLAEAGDTTPARLPFVFCEQFGRDEFEALSQALEATL